MTLPPGPTPPDALPALARMLITDERFASCHGTVMDANPDMPEEMAGRIVEEGIKFGPPARATRESASPRPGSSTRAGTP